jgi:hypothetical protein
MSNLKELELDKLKSFYEYLKDERSKTQNIEMKNMRDLKNYFSSYFTFLKKFDYFKFIPKDTTKLSEANIKLAIEMNCMLKYYRFQSYIIGANYLYFALLFSRKKSVFSITSFFALSSSFILVSLIQKYQCDEIFKVMDGIYYKEIEYLYGKMSREQGGFNKNVNFS